MIDSRQYTDAMLAARSAWGWDDRRVAFVLVMSEGAAVAAFAVPPSVVDALTDSVSKSIGKPCVAIDVHAGHWGGGPDVGTPKRTPDDLLNAARRADFSQWVEADIMHAKKVWQSASEVGARWSSKWDWRPPRHRVVP